MPCKNLKCTERLNGSLRWLCEERGTAYCMMNMLEYPDFATLENECKNFKEAI